MKHLANKNKVPGLTGVHLHQWLIPM